MTWEQYFNLLDSRICKLRILLEERIDKLESSQCPHLKVGIATLNTKDMYCIQHSVFKENQPTNDLKPLTKTFGDFMVKEKPKDSKIIYAKESFLDLQKMLEQQKIIIGDKNKEIERLKSDNRQLGDINVDIGVENERLKSEIIKEYRCLSHGVKLKYSADLLGNYYFECPKCSETLKIIERALEHNSKLSESINREEMKEILEGKS